jgi:tetraacyldisaccharide 4'-kinase
MRHAIASFLDRIWYGGGRSAWCLLPLTWLYRLAFAVHRRSSMPRRAALRRRIPIVVVGNLTVGGTGKTPLVLYLVEQLRDRGFTPAIVSRGYRAKSQGAVVEVLVSDDVERVGDEPLLLARRSGCPVVVGADRRAAVAYVAAQTGADVVVSDDGLQHHALPRDFEIVVVDGKRGLGNGLCLPAGPLREPATRLNCVDAVVVNGAGWSCPGALQAKVRADSAVRFADGAVRALADFAGRQVHAVAGIGHPERFFGLLEKAGLRVIAHPHEDHASLASADVGFGDELPVFVTEKDAVKLPTGTQAEVWVVRIDMEFEPGDGKRLVDAIVAKIGQRK